MTITATREMTIDERMQLIEHHATVEFAQDWDAAWDTLDDEGSYDYHPLGLRISGKENLHEHWRRLFMIPELKDPTKIELTRLIQDDNIVLATKMPLLHASGAVIMSTTTALFTFRGDKILREIVFTDTLAGELIGSTLDEEFRSRPGVSAIPTF